MAFDRYSDFPAAMSGPDELAPGTPLLGGRFRIRAFLNSGGFGVIYHATNSLGADVVVKECFVPALCRREGTAVVARSETSKPLLQKAIRGFLTEAQTLSTLSHANILRAHQTFHENGTAYMVVDHVPGHDLLDVIEEDRASLPPDRIVALARRLVEAMAHVHDRRVLHCDIAPDNIRLTPSGQPVLIDFGSARKCGPLGAEPHAGFSMVKDGYSPPELYTPDAPCGPSSDIYAMGATLYHAVAGAAPTDAQARVVAGQAGLPDPLTPLAGSVPGYPEGFLAGIDRALSLKPQARFASARDWLRTLSAPADAPRPSAAPRRLVVTRLAQAGAATPRPEASAGL